MVTTPDYAGLFSALTSYQQADEDGVMVVVSRQACDEAATALRTLLERSAALERLLASVRDDAMKLDNDFCAMEARAEAAEARVKELEEAIKVKGGTEHAPTEWAYLKVCEIADKYKACAESAEAKLAEARKALEPFAMVAEHDISEDETDSDAFRPMPKPFNHAPQITVGHLRTARRVREGGKVDD